MEWMSMSTKDYSELSSEKKKWEGLRQQNVVFGFFKVSKALQMAMYKKYNPEKKIARASGSKM